MDSISSFLNSIIGSYTPVTYDVIQGDATNQVIPSGLAGVDWSYVFSGIIFCICIYSIFRLIGGLFK